MSAYQVPDDHGCVVPRMRVFAMTTSWMMKVENIFHIGPYTVFVGLISGRAGVIGNCRVEVYCDDQVVKSINIEGEDSFRAPLHSIRARGHVEFDRQRLLEGRYRLVYRRYDSLQTLVCL